MIDQGRGQDIQIDPIKVHIHITDLLSYRNGYMEGITQAMLYIDQKYNTEEKGFFKTIFDLVQSIYFKICESIFGYVSDNKCDTPTKVSIEFPAVEVEDGLKGILTSIINEPLTKEEIEVGYMPQGACKDSIHQEVL